MITALDTISMYRIGMVQLTRPAEPYRQRD